MEPRSASTKKWRRLPWAFWIAKKAGSSQQLPCFHIIVAAGPVSRILSAGSLRAGRPFLWARHRCEALATYPEVCRAEPARARNRNSALPPYLVLLRVGFALPAALLQRRCALTAPFHPYSGVAAEAVYFLWHFPSTGLEPGLPDVIRHTALRSSDFPPSSLDATRAAVRSSCPLNHYMRCPE